MSIAFDRFCLILLFANPNNVVLSTYMGVGGCICLSSLRVMQIGKAFLAFKKVLPVSVSAAEEATVLMI